MNKLFLICATVGFTLVGCTSEKDNSSENNLEEKTEVKQNVYDQKTTAGTVSKEQLQGVLAAYFDIKNALVLTDAAKAKSASSNFLAKLGGEMEELKKYALNIQNGEDVEEIRADFEDLSKSMYAVVKDNTDASEETVYKQYCPMAFNNQGAYWLSNEKEIRNPYFGDKMLKCGKVQEEL
jgi:hypothetical protein